MSHKDPAGREGYCAGPEDKLWDQTHFHLAQLSFPGKPSVFWAESMAEKTRILHALEADATPMEKIKWTEEKIEAELWNGSCLIVVSPLDKNRIQTLSSYALVRLHGRSDVFKIKSRNVLSALSDNKMDRKLCIDMLSSFILLYFLPVFLLLFPSPPPSFVGMFLSLFDLLCLKIANCLIL